MHGHVCVCVCAVRLCVSTSTVRSGYRLAASPTQDSMRVVYYLEKELGQFPSAKMAALKRKPAQIGPVSVVCVWLCDRVYMSVFLMYVHAGCRLTPPHPDIHFITSNCPY